MPAKPLNPMPEIGEILRGFRQILVPEMNLGQLLMLIRAKYLIDARGLNKVRGQPFTIVEITNAARAMLAGQEAALEAAAEDEEAIAGGG